VPSEAERPREVILMTASQPTGHPGRSHVADHPPPRAGPPGPDPSAGAPRLTGSHGAILNDASAGNTP
jgi:hypothetical protein